MTKAKRPPKKPTRYKGALGRPWTRTMTTALADALLGQPEADTQRRWKLVLGLLLEHYGLDSRPPGLFGLGHENVWLDLACCLARAHVPLARDLQIPGRAGRPRKFSIEDQAAIRQALDSSPRGGKQAALLRLARRLRPLQAPAPLAKQMQQWARNQNRRKIL